MAFTDQITDLSYCVWIVPSSGGRWDPACCAFNIWSPDKHCVIRAPAGAHSGSDAAPTRWRGGRWCCRVHRDCNPEHGEEEPEFVKYAELRLVGGRSAPLVGRPAWETFFRVTEEAVTLHARRRGVLPKLPGRLCTNDAIFSRMHTESPQDQFDHTSLVLRRGLLQVGASLDTTLLTCSGDLLPPDSGSTALPCLPLTLVEKMSALWVSACASTRIGGPEFVAEFTADLARNPLPALAMDSTELSSVALRTVRGLLERKINPFTEAHLPHSVAYKVVSNFIKDDGEQPREPGRDSTTHDARTLTVFASRYWAGLCRDGRDSDEAYESVAGIDASDDEALAVYRHELLAVGTPGAMEAEPLRWRLMLPLARAVALELLRGSMAEADAIVQSVPTWGGTGFLRKGPLRHAAWSMAELGWAALPADYDVCTNVGPGARSGLDDLRPAPQTHAKTPRERGAAASKVRRKMHYAGASSKIGKEYAAELGSVHKWLEETGKKAALEHRSGATWDLHATQSALCIWSKYKVVRKWLLKYATLRAAPPVHPETVLRRGVSLTVAGKALLLLPGKRGVPFLCPERMRGVLDKATGSPRTCGALEGGSE